MRNERGGHHAVNATANQMKFTNRSPTTVFDHINTQLTSKEYDTACRLLVTYSAAAGCYARNAYARAGTRYARSIPQPCSKIQFARKTMNGLSAQYITVPAH